MAQHWPLSWRLLPRYPITARGTIKLSLLACCWGKQFPNTFTTPALSFCGSNPLCFHRYVGITAASNNPLLGPNILGQHFRTKGTERARKPMTGAEGCNAEHGQRQLGKPRKYAADKWLSSWKGMGETGRAEVVLRQNGSVSKAKQNEVSKALLRRTADPRNICSFPGWPIFIQLHHLPVGLSSLLPPEGLFPNLPTLESQQRSIKATIRSLPKRTLIPHCLALHTSPALLPVTVSLQPSGSSSNPS